MKANFFTDISVSKWKAKGVAFILAHPDDEAIMFATIQEIKKHSIPLYFIYTTDYGDKGRLYGKKASSPEQVKETRKKECEQAMKYLGAKQYVALQYPDMEISYQDKRAIEKKMMSIVRKWDTAAIFSFHPFEITPYFDHPDHRKTGEIALDVSAGTNVHHLHTETPCNKVSERPEIFLWTTNKYFCPTYAIPIKNKIRKQRNTYLTTCHPSQFCLSTMNEWSKIFDAISSNTGGTKQRELWVHVR